jgi:anti-sigma regulatory factor (Ser/Thr protein kinase)
MDIAGSVTAVTDPNRAFARSAPSRAVLSAGFQLPLGPQAPRVARHTLRSVLAGWQLTDTELIHDATLVASELVTNAIRHCGEIVSLEVHLDSDVLEVAVRDGDAVLPRPRSTGNFEESGRGLAIVAAVATDWGAEARPDGGKRVWVRLAVAERNRG